jgi:hypothetical protein
MEHILSETAQQQQQLIFNNNEYARQITNLNDYGHDAEIYDHREKLNSTFIEHFKLDEFYTEFKTNETNFMEVRRKLYLFVSRETYEVCPEYDNIRDAVHRFFNRINNEMKRTSDGYFWRQKAKTLSSERYVSA